MTSGQLRALAQYSEAEVGEGMLYEFRREEDLREDECLEVGWGVGHLVFDVVWVGMTGRLGVEVKREPRECYLSLCVVEEEK